MNDLEDLIEQAAAAGCRAFNLFWNPSKESYQANVYHGRKGSFKIETDEDPITALKAALKHGIKASKPKKKTADDLL